MEHRVHSQCIENKEHDEYDEKCNGEPCDMILLLLMLYEKQSEVYIRK